MPRDYNNKTRDSEYRALYDEGLTCVEMGVKMEVSTSAAAQWCRKNGLVPHGNTNVPLMSRAVNNGDIETRPIPSLPGFSVSKDGRVFNEKYKPPRQMMPRPHGGTCDSRLRVSIGVGGRLRYFVVGALVLESWHSPRPDGWIVKFLDGNGQNCHLDNLEWSPSVAKIDPVEFVAVWQDSYSRREVAERLGVNYTTVAVWEAKLRDHGVHLKKLFSGNVSGIDGDELNKMIREME